MTAFDLTEIFLRGAALGIYIALLTHTLAWAGQSAAARLVAIAFCTSALYSVFATPAIDDILGSWTLYLKAIGSSTPGWFWLGTLAIFNDNFKWENWRLIPVFLIACGNLVFSLYPDIPDLYRLLQLIILLPIFAATFHAATSNEDDDLVVSRRRFSNALRKIIPSLVVAVALISLYEVFQLYAVGVRIAVSLMLLGITLSLIMVMSRMDSKLFPDHSGETPPLPDQQDLTAADRIDLNKLQANMVDGAYLNGRLTIAILSQSLDIPEHRLRKLINQHLGYRNFTAYLNKFRIDEAMKRLSDPNLARTQITNLAFDIGYGSLAPFNRAFKQRNGVSPTEWRETTLAGKNADDQAATLNKKL